MARYLVHQSDGNEAEIIDALERVGATVEKIGRPLDLLVGYQGRTFLLEVKTARGAIRPSQSEFIARWRGHAVVVRSVDAALAAIGVQS